MPLSNLDHKKVYYYVICVMAFFVLMWGMVDLASTSVGLLKIRGSETTMEMPVEENALSPEKSEQLFDTYYQSKMLSDRFWDSLARVIIGGVIFAYCRFTVNKLEAQS
ncbi:MAG: hypothetical protein ABIH69_03870 [bacterium]|nr:hypothetical protein [Candidatus Margulisiibacteriota bacterium]